MSLAGTAKALFEALGGDAWAAEQIDIWVQLKTGLN